MAKTRVTVEMDGDEQKLFRKFIELERKLAAQEAAMRKVNRAGEQAGRTMQETGKHADDAFGAKAAANLKSFALGVMGVAGAVGAVHKAATVMMEEIQKHLDESRKSKGAIVDLSAAQDLLMQNMVGKSEAERKDVMATIGAMAKETKVPTAALTKAMADAMSASEGNIERSKAAIELAAQYMRSQPEAIPAFVGTLLDLGKATDKLTGGVYDAKVSLGMLARVGGMSRITSLEEQAEVIAPAVIASVLKGATPSGAGALFAATTSAVGERHGAVARTAQIDFAGKLAEFGMKALEIKQELPKELVAWKGTEFGVQMDYLRSHTDLATKLMAEAPGVIKDTKGGLTRGMADRWAGMSLDEQLDYVEKRRKTIGEKLVGMAPAVAGTKRFEAIPGWSGMSMTDRIRFLQGDRERAEAMMSTTGMRQQMRPAYEMLMFDASSTIAKSFEQNIKDFGGAPELRAEADRQLKSLDIPTGASVANLQRLGASTEEQIRLRQEFNALMVTERDNLVAALGASGQSAMGKRFAEFGFDIDLLTGRRKGAEGFIAAARQEARAIGQPRVIPSMGPTSPYVTKPTEEGKALAGILIEHANGVERIMKEWQQKTAEASNKMKDAVPLRQKTLTAVDEDR